MAAVNEDDKSIPKVGKGFKSEGQLRKSRSIEVGNKYTPGLTYKSVLQLSNMPMLVSLIF